MEEEIEQAIRSLALENALKFGGKANAGAVIGPILAKYPEQKKDIRMLSKAINDIITEINKLSAAQQQDAFAILGSVKEEKIARDKTLKDLPNVDPKKGVVMRFAPSPSGPMHIGHALTGSMSSQYVERYGGTFILRIEDTNSDNIYEPAYELLPKDAEWIFGNVSEVLIQSDRMEKYYAYVETFIDKQAAYVCTCSQEQFKEYSTNKTDCPCRSLPKAKQQERWAALLTTYKEGEAVVRFKSSMQDKNPALRDFPLMRINESEHPRQGKKYRAWPLMNLSVTVDDIESGMTHIIRAKDHQDNAKKQKMMYDVLGKPFPETLFLGRINFLGLDLSSSKTKERIEQGDFEGWTDVRLPFLGALRRRGYQPAALKRYAQEMGVTPVDKKVSAKEFFKTLNAFNKEIIDPVSRRYFFVDTPKKVVVKGAPKTLVTMDLHPDHQKGGRTLQGQEQILLAEADTGLTNFRLRDYCNVICEEGKYISTTKSFEDFKGKNIIHWLPDSAELIETVVVMPDNTKRKGKSEQGIRGLSVGDIIQFERFGFCRLDAISKDVYYFCFAHR